MLHEMSWSAFDEKPRFEASPAVPPLPVTVSRQTSEPQRGDQDARRTWHSDRPTSALRAQSRAARSASQTHRRRGPLGVSEGASPSLRNRLPHARQCSRGRGHRAGRLGTLADGRSQRGSGCRGVPRDDGDTIGDQRHQSARSRRETYVGRWLPEPVDTSADPRLEAERGQALAFGVLLLLEKLTPTERAAYILREAFDYPYRDIANVLRLEEANARQVVTRARQHVANGRRMPASSTEQRRLLDAFIAAAQDGDVAGLEGLFASAVAA